LMPSGNCLSWMNNIICGVNINEKNCISISRAGFPERRDG
jgi:hypothetical protein